jgi:hypothetical protein
MSFGIVIVQIFRIEWIFVWGIKQSYQCNLLKYVDQTGMIHLEPMIARLGRYCILNVTKCTVLTSCLFNDAFCNSGYVVSSIVSKLLVKRAEDSSWIVTGENPLLYLLYTYSWLYNFILKLFKKSLF